MTQLPQPPAVVPKPELALWIWQRGLSLKRAGELFGCSYEQVRLMCLPFADQARRVPDTDLMRRIIDATAGEIGLKHFYPPELRGDAQDAP